MFLGKTFAQQEAMFTHYSFNTIQVNPAYAGSREVTSATILHRSQWVGFDGAPITQTFTINSPIFSNSLCAGLSVINDQIGPIQTSGIYADLTYRLKLSEKTKLAVGLKGGGDWVQSNLEDLTIINETDPLFNKVNSRFLPNVGAGVYLNNPKWYVGFSSPKVVESSISKNSVSSFDREQRHYWLIGGMIMKVSNTIKLKPTTFIKTTVGAPVQGDLTAMFIFKDKFELGIMGRTGDAVGGLLGYNFNTKLRLGYSFDWSFQNTTGMYNAGSHEVMLRYDIYNSLPNRIYSPRFF